MSRVLVTGADGFLGKKVIELLIKHDLPFIGVSRKRATLQRGNPKAGTEILRSSFEAKKDEVEKGLESVYDEAIAADSISAIGVVTHIDGQDTGAAA